ncbi:MAG: hypothetical protein O2923_14990, partial [Verrucomicrobia bacterium]|nr:hypothetical protein [Verrucomicrobiota bacterium]
IPVIAFEETEQGRRLLHKNVALNELQARIRIDGRCEPEDLARALQSLPALVLVDVEGYEGVLLDPQRVPGLMQCHMVVEIHDHIEPGVGRRIVERFAPSHNVVAIPCESRHLGDIQNLGVMQKLYLKSILKRWMRERIGDSGWLYMTPMYRPHG